MKYLIIWLFLQAVRHLPASQQEEYRRLKQQILEREKLKLHKTIENNSLIKNKNMEVSSKPISSNSSSKELYAKRHHTIPSKSQSISTQQLNKENCSKNLADSVKNTTISTSNIQSCISKMYDVDKQEHADPTQIKALTKSIINNICVSAESSPNNIGNKAVGNMQPTNISRKSLTKTKTSPSLKILSTDEVNRKYVQIQVKNDTNNRVVTINDKVTLNNETIIDRSENISGNKNSSNKNIYDNDPTKEDVVSNNTPFGNNTTVDSNTSTIILSRTPQSWNESLNTSESTIYLPRCQEDTLLIPCTKDKHDIHFLSPKNNISPKDIRSIEENWEEIKKDVKTELNTLINLSRAEQEQRLIDTEQELVMKR